MFQFLIVVVLSLTEAVHPRHRELFVSVPVPATQAEAQS